MLSSKECAEVWKGIRGIFDSMGNPREQMREMIESFGIDKITEAFAVVTQIKKHDGRIYGKNRDEMERIQVNPECLKRDCTNDMMGAGLDDIHPTHINRLITELRKFKEEN